MKTILATDGSPFARLAEELVRKVPSIAAGEVVIATAVSPPTIPMMGMEPLGAPLISEDLQRMFDAQLEAANRIADEVCGRMTGLGLNCRSEIVEGEAGHALLDLIEREAPDHIAIGNRGIGGLEGFLLGSVAKELVAKAPCSVLVARAYEGLGIEDSIERLTKSKKLKLGAGYDATPGSQHVLDLVKAQGKDAFAELHVICAEPLGVLPAGVNPADFSAVYADDHDRVVEIIRKGEEQLDGYAEVVSGGEGVGEAADVLSQFAKVKGLDLLAIGATQHGFLERFLLGSVSSELAARAACSVWVVRPPKSAAP